VLSGCDDGLFSLSDIILLWDIILLLGFSSSLTVKGVRLLLGSITDELWVVSRLSMCR